MAPAPLLAAACLACTLAMFGTGLSDLRQMLATQSVENIQFLPFLATDANNLGWLGYGCLKRDPTLVAVNAVGAALNTLCVLVYLRYSPHKRRVLLRSLALLAPLAAGYGYACRYRPPMDPAQPGQDRYRPSQAAPGTDPL
ncbi:sugar transporter SWEET1 [Nothoprocta perdicaria]|uniref:sugar transporter SWEET1 n=1 Tax=Nothoprocta perdicaria TaxID=30464 RepID=UPI000E1BF93F|nr:sugar transporter SWEET1 [Nothoprocta perdicaria]